ncbi:MAG: dihydrolipoyllysine-residue succinyltransferase [Thiobacillaceae bacterium]|jgi:2-oxoglutarate dehydrogenase E2 component (dihydrolipoamide succinyltransferase)
MNVDVKVPELSESVSSGTLLAWRKRPGENVARDETLADLETDKVILEIPAPANGILKEVRVQEGAEVKANEVVAVIDTAGLGQAEPARLAEVIPAKKDAVVLALPVANKEPPAQASPKAAEPVSAMPKPASYPQGDRPERRVPMSRLRQRVAERLVAAQHTAAILSTFNEVNLQQVNELRQRYKVEFEARHGVKLGYMSFFVRAVCVVLKQFPILNARIDGDDVVYQDFADVGIAVSTPRGLVVPILRNADRMSFAEIEKSIADFAARAQTGSLALDELTGGTFSITNGGVFGSLLSTPILNPPQSGILGMHKIQERPVAENGQVVIRPMMYLALSYDHRLIDGKDAVEFLAGVKRELEAPERLLLHI